MTTKTADSKGRISLGSRFANQTVIVEDVDATEVRVILAQVVPQREVWLHKNPKAKASVLRGLAQAKAEASLASRQKKGKAKSSRDEVVLFHHETYHAISDPN